MNSGLLEINKTNYQLGIVSYTTVNKTTTITVENYVLQFFFFEIK